MKTKLLLPGVLFLLIVSVVIPADEVNWPFHFEGVRLSKSEMLCIHGRLFILDIEPSDTIVEFDYSQKTSDPDREHCDIIAQNQAAESGLDTRDQSGSFCDYNETLVRDIYEGYPENRSAEPEEGTSGYYFSSYGNGKEHMGTYSRKTGSRTYTRNSNRSYSGTESSSEVSPGYKPEGVTSQIFVSLPRLPFFKRFHR